MILTVLLLGLLEKSGPRGCLDFENQNKRLEMRVRKAARRRMAARQL